jgi:NAD-dependent SIR2 family protein deacetylase
MSERLAELIHQNQPVVALTGAGISTESGAMYP